MPIYGCVYVCRYIYLCLPYVRIPTGYGGQLGDFAMDTLYSEMVLNDEENGCRFEDSRNETCSTHDLCGLIVVRARLLEFYSDPAA